MKVANTGKPIMVPVGPKTSDMQDAAAQWMRMWQEMYRLWLGPWAQMMPTAYAPPPYPGNWGWPADASSPVGFGTPAQATGTDADVMVTLEASQPVSVSVRLLQASGNAKARAVLHCDSGTDKLTAKLDAAGVHVKVPAHQGPGIYSGVLHDAHGAQLGMVTVHVSAAKER